MVSPGESMFFPPEANHRSPPEALVRILVVEDEISLARAIAALLHSSDRLIEDCASVAEALARLQTRSFDLIILDFRLPDATGLAVMDWLISHERRESVIMISGEESMEAPIGALRRGAVDFLRKPYDPEQLRRAVNRVLERRQSERRKHLNSLRLRSSEQMHRYLVEASQDLIFTLDPEGHFTYLNPRIETLLGHPRDTLLGKHFSVVVHAEDLERARHVFRERRTGQRASCNVEVRLGCNPCGLPDATDHGPIVVALNSTGIYETSPNELAPRYSGTYGSARHITLPRPLETGPPVTGLHDPLTQLPNRDIFRDRLDLAIIQAKRNKGRIAVMLLDVDRSGLDASKTRPDKTINAETREALLRAAALRLKQCLRRGDTLSRLAGDEFAVLLPEINGQDDARAIAEKILEAFQRPFTLPGREGKAAVGIGIALHPEDGNNANDLIQHAGVALYQVKRGSLNQYRFFVPDMHTTFRERLALEKELRQAIARSELALDYQPLISLSRNCVTGVEALLRWHHPTRGLIAPAYFIQLAEDAGFIHEISRWVLDTACAQVSTWRRRYPELRLVANLSPRDFDRADLGEHISRTLSRNGLPAACLEVEIHENLLLEDSERIAPLVKDLRDLGVGLAIDDFGTGYSSLAYLQHYAVTRLKIARSFVRDLNGSGQHPIIHAIAGIARGLAIPIAAEGVERDDQAAALGKLGCDEMQGYLFSRPVSSELMSRILQDFRPSMVAGPQTGSGTSA